MNTKKKTDAEQIARSSISWTFHLLTKYAGDPSTQVFDVVAIHPSGAADEAQAGYYPETEEIFIGGFEHFVGREAELFGEGTGSEGYRQLFDDLRAWLRAEVLSADKAD